MNHPSQTPSPRSTPARRPGPLPLLGLLAAAAWLVGCSIDKHTVIASTGTNLGIDVAADASTQTPRIKLGYNRGELALVPSNRSANKEPGSRLAAALCDKCARGEAGCTTPEKCKAARQNTRDGGATDTAEVLMEIRMQGGILFNGIQDAGLYQRLAVGKTAVQQPGAALMFARDKKGEISSNAAPAVKAAVQAAPGVVQTTSASILGRAELREAFLRYREAGDTATAAKFETAAQAAGYKAEGGRTAFQAFVSDAGAGPEKIDLVRKSLEAQGVKLTP
jgi:hypothetical protein